MAIKISGTTVIDDSRNITNINTVATGNVTVTGDLSVSSNVGIGTTAQTDMSLYIEDFWTAAASRWGEYAYVQDSNTAMSSAISKYGVQSVINNRNQNKSSDGLTTYLGNYRAVVGDAQNGSTSSGGNAFASELIGGNFRSYQYANGAGSNGINVAVGSRNQVWQYGSGVILNAYGTQAQISAGNNSITGNINEAYATYSTITSNTASTIANGYLFYGSHAGATTTNKWGVYVTGETKNYLSGNVGIGTIVPTGKIHVVGNDTSVPRIYTNSTNTTVIRTARQNTLYIGAMADSTFGYGDGFGPKMIFRTGQNELDGFGAGAISTVRAGADNTHDMRLSTYNAGTESDVMTLAGNGNIGIGNTVPTNKLSVNGTTYLAGNIILGSASVAVGLQANGNYGTSGQVLTSNGTATYWATAAAGVNTAAQYAWTNTHSFSSMVTFSNATNTSNTTAAAWFNQGTGTLAFDTNMVKRISWNDGTGNFNIRAGNYYNGTALVYNNDGTNSGGATISLNVDGADGVITFNTWPIGVSGATVSGGTSMALNTTAFYIGSNTTIVGFANVSSNINAASFNVGATKFANTTGVYATFMNGKTEGNLNVNNATTSTKLTTADIPNAADLNNYTTTGIYHQGLNAQAASGSNYPIAEAGLLEVYTGGSMVYQRYTHFSSGRIYTRSKYLTTWYSWLTELDSGNYSSYALPLSGGSMTGSISFASNSGNGINLNGTDTTMHRIYMDSFYTIFKSHANEGWKFRDNSNVDRLTILGANGNMATSGSVSGGLFGIAADGNNRFIQGGLILRSGSPTIYFRDTDHNSAMIHNNSNLLYILRGGNDTESWTAISGEWPWYWNLTDNSSRCGGALNVVNDITAFVSDRRLKTDIETLEDSLSKVKQITGIRYRHNEFAKSKNLPEGPHVGVIAQELEKVLPEAIAPAPFDTDEHGKSKSGENYKTVKYDKIVPLLIEAIKELSGQVDDLKKELEGFKKK